MQIAASFCTVNERWRSLRLYTHLRLSDIIKLRECTVDVGEDFLPGLHVEAGVGFADFADDDPCLGFDLAAA